VPSLYENSPSSFLAVELSGIPYIQYKTNRYSVPRSCAYGKVYYKAVGSYLYVYDDTYSLLCRHAISECHGRVIRLPEHKKEPATDWISTAERLRDKWNCYDFQHFINGVKKENPRHISKQLGAIEQFLNAENPDKSLVAEVMKICCKNLRYQFSQFKVVYEYTKAGRSLADTEGAKAAMKADPVDYRQLSVYGKAFADRVAGGSKEVTA
ncbi:MAG: hypothetical protein II047_12345, partial [Bacteroidales bacterium]|nr:hypothetical protein [Bacteroidales bacterium]